MTASLACIAILALGADKDVLAWTFDTDADLKAWVPNAFLANVKVAGGAVSADAVDWDPFFTCQGLTFPATPWQYVLLRIKANRPGQGQLFWSAQTSGQYGGLSPNKNTTFQVKGSGAWEEIPIFPFWQAEGTIRQLRLDVYDGAHFDIDYIRILTWGKDEPPKKDTYSWQLGGNLDAWRVHPAADVLLAPRLHLDVDGKDWVTLQIRSDKDGSAGVVWASAGLRGLQHRNFVLRGDGKPRHYNVEMAGISAWKSPVVAFGIQLPSEAGVRVESIQIAAEPTGPPEVVVDYFGFENAIQRAGRPARVLAQFSNEGGSPGQDLKMKLDLPQGVTMVEGSPEQTLAAVDYDEQQSLTWTVRAAAPGHYKVKLIAQGQGAPQPTETVLHFLEPLNPTKADYVPPPRPVKTDIDVCAYYFPGWNNDAKWDCIRRVAPIRKPLLGYYDEANPECVDWQIKWSVENGISVYLVDWYWVQGRQHLQHWFDAYRKARYRDDLKVAIMWANHNPPKTHSVEDWRNVTKEWIDKYFNLKTYYHVDGKPALFLWNPTGLRNDVGGSDVVAKCFQESQEMARAAGHKGITFIAMFGHESEAGVKALLKEGYYGATNYHEWAEAPQLVKDIRSNRYEDINKTVRKAWETKVARCGKLVYYPVVDTGWDARPWHGDRSRVILGRTPDEFEAILRQAKAYCSEIGRKFVVLGPLNEWGEGSYIEPNLEFGFDMLERVRKVFAKGDPSSWPKNVAPSDVGLGPYEFPASPKTTSWTFDNGAGGWSAMMGVSEPVVKDGALRFKTVSHDPAIMVSTGGIRARDFKKVVIRMQLEGKIPPGDGAQVFFSVSAAAMTEATSFRFPLAADGKMTTYTVDLTQVPRWRGRITTLRFDPCGTNDVNVALDEIRLE
ncbi:MAG: glycoside hydrolase family 99-like domain-containing protein [Phycisphaerae bacterium]|nr:glycoside hydrolase family 99-like domain-containing protein [Phycisphaerae bacterium]